MEFRRLGNLYLNQNVLVFSSKIILNNFLTVWEDYCKSNLEFCFDIIISVPVSLRNTLKSTVDFSKTKFSKRLTELDHVTNRLA